MAKKETRLKIENTTVFRGKVVIPGEEIDASSKEAERLVARKLATVVEKTKTPNNQNPVNDGLDDMDISELLEYANEAGVDIESLTEKADIIDAIRKAE